MEFKDWLLEELHNRGLGVREFARVADLGSGTISRIMTGSRKPGIEVCQAIARALKIPEEEVFSRAGVFTRPSQVYTLFNKLSDSQRDAILKQMRAMVAENVSHYHAKTIPDT